MNQPVNYSRSGRLGVLCTTNPAVNALTNAAL